MVKHTRDDSGLGADQSEGPRWVSACSLFKVTFQSIHNNEYDCEWKWNNDTNDAEGRIKKNVGIIFRVYPGYSEESYWGAPFQPLFPFSQQNYMSRYHFYQAVRRELPLAWGNHEHKLSLMCMRILISIACEFIDINDPQCKDQLVWFIMPYNLGHEWKSRKMFFLLHGLMQTYAIFNFCTVRQKLFSE